MLFIGYFPSIITFTEILDKQHMMPGILKIESVMLKKKIQIKISCKIIYVIEGTS